MYQFQVVEVNDTHTKQSDRPGISSDHEGPTMWNSMRACAYSLITSFDASSLCGILRSRIARRICVDNRSKYASLVGP